VIGPRVLMQVNKGLLVRFIERLISWSSQAAERGVSSAVKVRHSRCWHTSM